MYPKAVVAQSWEKLSDPQMEFALNDRLSVIRFVGLSVMGKVPDHSTICRFRNRLIELNILDDLLGEVNRQLRDKGFMVKERPMAVIDATLTSSQARPKKVLDILPEDRKEDEFINAGMGTKQEGDDGLSASNEFADTACDISEAFTGNFEDTENTKEASISNGVIDADVSKSSSCSEDGRLWSSEDKKESKKTVRKHKGQRSQQAQQTKMVYSKDPDASWLKKGNKIYYGYKQFVCTDGKGFILGGMTTPANFSEVSNFKAFIDRLDLSAGYAIYADKGYCSEDNRLYISDRYEDMIMYKGARGRSLTKFQKWHNDNVSKVRYVVEQTIGILKKHHDYWKSRFMGLAKVQLEFQIHCIALNLKKASRMMSLA